MPDLSEADLFIQYRPLMFAIAYRMLGSATEAEDMIQEAYLRYRATPPDEIMSAKAFLITIVTRLSLNQLQSARMQRESYIGPWLPEPLLTDDSEFAGPVQRVELHDSLSLAFLTLLEQLTPLERAVFLLREVFEYDYAEIAEMLGKEEAACRQMLSRARKHIAANRPPYQATPEAHQQLLDRFVKAASEGELDGLMALLTEDVTLWADGGGKTRGAALHPLRGRENVGRFVLASIRLLPGPFHVERAVINGEMALLIGTGDGVRIVLAVGGQDGQVSEIRVIGNPDKLKWVGKLDSDGPNEEMQQS